MDDAKRQIKAPIAGVKNSWDFFRNLASNLNVDIGYNNFVELRELMNISVPHLSKINHPIQHKTPVIKSNSSKFNYTYI